MKFFSQYHHHHVAAPALRRRTHVSVFALVVYWHDPNGTPIAAYQVPGLHRVEVQRPIFEALTIIIYKSYAVATLQYSRPFISINYARIVALFAASFWGITMSLYYSTTIKLLPLTKLITGSYPSLRTSLRC